MSHDYNSCELLASKNSMFSRNQLSDFFFQTPLYFSVTELMNKLAHEKCLVDMDVFFAKMKLQNLQRPTVVEEQM